MKPCKLVLSWRIQDLSSELNLPFNPWQYVRIMSCFGDKNLKIKEYFIGELVGK